MIELLIANIVVTVDQTNDILFSGRVCFRRVQIGTGVAVDMPDFNIVAVKKSSSCGSGYRHIEGVWYRLITQGGGYEAYAPRQEMAEKLQYGLTAVATGQDGSQAPVLVRRCACSVDYLTTKPDASKQDNLDNLIERW